MRAPPWWFHWYAVVFSLWWGIQSLIDYRPEPDGFFWLGLPSWLMGGMFIGSAILAAAGMLFLGRKPERGLLLSLMFAPQQALLVSIGVSLIMLYLASPNPELMFVMAWAVLVPVFYTIATVRYLVERIEWRFTLFPWRR